jgi:hypothetical protein
MAAKPSLKLVRFFAWFIAKVFGLLYSFGVEVDLRQVCIFLNYSKRLLLLVVIIVSKYIGSSSASCGKTSRHTVGVAADTQIAHRLSVGDVRLSLFRFANSARRQWHQSESTNNWSYSTVTNRC